MSLFNRKKRRRGDDESVARRLPPRNDLPSTSRQVRPTILDDGGEAYDPYDPLAVGRVVSFGPGSLLTDPYVAGHRQEAGVRPRSPDHGTGGAVVTSCPTDPDRGQVMGDPLADVIHKAEHDWGALLDKRVVVIPDLADFQADAVRAFLAKVFAAEEAKWAARLAIGRAERSVAEDTIDSLRAALGIEA